MKKRAFALLLSVLMILQLFPMLIFAETETKEISETVYVEANTLTAGEKYFVVASNTTTATTTYELNKGSTTATLWTITRTGSGYKFSNGTSSSNNNLHMAFSRRLAAELSIGSASTFTVSSTTSSNGAHTAFTIRSELTTKRNMLRSTRPVRHRIPIPSRRRLT